MDQNQRFSNFVKKISIFEQSSIKLVNELKIEAFYDAIDSHGKKTRCL